MPKGIKIVEETIGVGRSAESHDTCQFEIQLSLSRGDIVFERQFWTHELGRRMIIAGIEKSLFGMKEGGYRKTRVSPHLAYGEKGLEARVPANAVIVCEIWLHGVEKGASATKSTAV